MSKRLAQVLLNVIIIERRIKEVKEILDNIDMDEYFNWYSSWIDWKSVTAEQIKDGSAGVHPYNMFSEWLEIMAIKMDELQGKEVYYPLNAIQEDAITTDTYHEGVSIHKGRVEKVEKKVDDYNGYIVTIDSKRYYVSSPDARSLFYENKDMLIAQLHYDGEELYDGITLKKCFSADEFYVDRTE